jgi:hypothetical protein
MNKAQAEFIKKDVLSELDGQYDKVNPDAYPVLERILMAAGLEFNKQINVNLRRTSSISSGKLADIEAPLLYKFGNKYVLEVGYEIGSEQSKYFDFVNKGVKGVGGIKAKPKPSSGDYAFKTPYANKKMTTSILLWLKKGRNISFNESQTKRLTTIQRKNKRLKAMVTGADNLKKLAYSISSAIKRDGLKATYYYDKAMNTVFNKDFREAIQVALGAEVNIKVIKTWNNKLK